MLRRISLSFWDRGQWRKKWRHDSTSVLHLKIEFKSWKLCLTLSRRRPLSYRNQSFDLLPKSMDWFLYDNGLRLERAKRMFTQMTEASALSCDKLSSFRIMAMKETESLPYELQYILFKIMLQSVSFNSSWNKNEFSKKLCFTLNRGILSTFLVLKVKFCCGTILEG